ncbi:uncharacterized protein conserved in bacteria [Hahella chejuensis KCTC 2396]|uniref:Uncharacterized protein conserved in bacteria n=1 Tax=Hahella chejuensis (strain KCTC 2396) TaxID=349521 RepID=Q2S9N1_HAHCH|nr:DUF1249 domain-containing protein [Hahella chejuensis]ABC32643.1 uncharacterized protein conserved in bacteria [Hahella chejuensis KCTC 2396]
MKQRYVPDIAQFGAICEANYFRLSKLVADREAGSEVTYSLHNHTAYLGLIRIKVLESSRYTNLLFLEQVHAIGRWVNNPQLTVRIYHDARMAEVISAVNHARVEAVNDYPNGKMHLPDEKLQLNQFLSEWLNYCLHHGHSTEELRDL